MYKEGQQRQLGVASQQPGTLHSANNTASGISDNLSRTCRLKGGHRRSLSDCWQRRIAPGGAHHIRAEVDEITVATNKLM